MTFNEFPQVQTQINKTSIQKKIAESEKLQEQIKKFKSNGGVIKVFAAFGSAPIHCSYKNVNDSYHLTS